MSTTTRTTLIDDLWQSYIADRNITDRNALAEHYFNIVEIVAVKIEQSLPDAVQIGDLLSYGSAGLLDAISKFDPSRGLKFYTYGALRVRGAIYDGLRNDSTSSRLMLDRNKRMAVAEERLTQAVGYRPAVDEVAASVSSDASLQSKLRLNTRHGQPRSLNEMISREGSDHLVPRYTMLKDERCADPSHQVEVRETVEQCINWVLDNCRLTEALVLRLYYLDGMTQSEIAECLGGFSEGGISYIRSRILWKVRNAMLSNAA